MAWNTLKNYLTGSGGVTANAGTASTALGTIASGSDVLTTNFSGVKSTVDSLSLMASELAGGPYTVWKDSGVPSSVTSGAVSGQLYFDSATNKLYQYSSTGAWVEIGDLDNPGGVADVVLPYVKTTPAAAVQRTSDLTGYTSTSDITWQSAAYNTDSMWVSSAPTRLTINTTGLYAVNFSGLVSATATLTTVSSVIKLNGANYLYNYGANNATALRFTMSAVCPLTATDYLTASCELVGGSGYVIGGAAAPSLSNTKLSATWIGKTS